MQLSSRIIRGMSKNGEYQVLELRPLLTAVEEELPDSPGENMPEIDPAEEAARIIAEAGEMARSIIAEARADALGIKERARQEAREEADRIREDAWQQAFEQGRNEAIAGAQAEARAIREQALQVLNQAEEIRKKTLKSVEADIVRLSIEIAEKILLVKLDMHPQVVVDVALEAINLLQDRDQVILYVNPGETHLFEERRDELITHLSPKGELHIIADPGIQPGGCVAETGQGRIDAGLDTRWDNFLKALEDISGVR